MSKKKVVIHQKDVVDNESWRAECADGSGLLIVELYSEFFGYCQVLEPSISDLMKTLEEGEQDKIRWRRVNVLKLEEELKQIREEESKKNTSKDPSEEVALGRASADAPSGESGSGHQLRYLDRFPGYNHPQPFFLFMRQGEIYDILRECNPPLLEAMVKKYVKEDCKPEPNLTFEIVLKTEEEIRLEKEAQDKNKAHMNKIHTVIEKVDCEDPMSVTKAEAESIFKLFLDPETKQPFGRPDGNWEEYVADYEGKSVDVFAELFFDHVTDEQLEFILNPPEPTPAPVEVTPATICETVVKSCEAGTFTSEGICALVGKLVNEDMSPAAEDHAHVAAMVALEDQSEASIGAYLLETVWKSGDVNFENVESIIGDELRQVARSAMLSSILSGVTLPFTSESATELVGKLVNEDGAPADAENEVVAGIMTIAESAEQVAELLAEKFDKLKLNSVYVHGYRTDPVPEQEQND